MQKTFYLIPIYDTRKSFYEKALVIEYENYIFLKSYNTLVAVIKKSNQKLVLTENELFYTQTTLRHIKEFIKQFHCYENETKKELIKKYSFEYSTETIKSIYYNNFFK